MASDTYIIGGLAQPLLDYLDAEELDLPQLRATLQARSAQERVPIEKWWEWLETIQQTNFRAGLGIHIGQHALLHHLGLAGYLMLSCSDLQEALEKFQGFEALVHNLNPSSAVVVGNRLRISWDDSYGTSTQLSNEFLVSAMATNIRRLINDKHAVPLKVSFSGFAPEHKDSYEALMGCEVEFGAEKMSFDWSVSYLARKVLSSDPHLCKLLTTQAESLMESFPRPDPFIKELRDQLSIALGNGEISAEVIAETMQMPLRSFYRRLDQRGLNFKGLLRSIRYPLAKQYLGDKTLSLIEVALRLGYSDQSAFGRAFKNWHGTTPTQYRRFVVNDS